MKTYKGAPIIDATRDIRIVLAESDIVNGVQEDPHNCVIALALQRHLGARDVEIRKGMALVEMVEDGRSVYYRYMLSRDSKEFVARFDQGFFTGVDGRVRFPRQVLLLRVPAGSQKMGYKPKGLDFIEVEKGTSTVIGSAKFVEPRPRAERRPMKISLRSGTGRMQYSNREET